MFWCFLSYFSEVLKRRNFKTKVMIKKTFISYLDVPNSSVFNVPLKYVPFQDIPLPSLTVCPPHTDPHQFTGTIPLTNILNQIDRSCLADDSITQQAS